MSDDYRNSEDGPIDLATEAADAGIEAVRAFLKERGFDAKEVIVLVTTTEPRNGGGMYAEDEEDNTIANFCATLAMHLKGAVRSLGGDIELLGIDEIGQG